MVNNKDRQDNLDVILETARPVAKLAGTDVIVGNVVKEKYNGSLIYSIAEVMPVSTPFSKLFLSKKQFYRDDFEIVSKDIEIGVKVLDTKMSYETYQDIESQFKENAAKFAADIVKSVSDDEENMALMELLKNESYVFRDLFIDENDGLREQSFKIIRKLSDIIIKMNHKSFKSLEGWCIIPRAWANIILGSTDNKRDPENPSKYYIGTISNIHFYLSPLVDNDPWDEQYDNDEFSLDFRLGIAKNPLAPPTLFDKTRFNGMFFTSLDEIPEEPNCTVTKREHPKTSFDLSSTIGEEVCKDDQDFKNVYIGLVAKETGMSSLIFNPYSYEANWVINPRSMDNILFIRNRYQMNTSLLHSKFVTADEYTVPLLGAFNIKYKKDENGKTPTPY